MKKTKYIYFFLLILAVFVLTVGAVFLLRDDTSSIVGGWETEASVIGLSTVDKDTAGLLQFYFYDDLTGVEIAKSIGITNQREFTYQVSDDELCITYESGTVHRFPYSLDKNTLVLVQNSASITYHKITED